MGEDHGKEWLPHIWNYISPPRDAWYYVVDEELDHMFPDLDYYWEIESCSAEDLEMRRSILMGNTSNQEVVIPLPIASRGFGSPTQVPKLCSRSLPLFHRRTHQADRN